MGERPGPTQVPSDQARSVADFLKRSKLAAIPPLNGSQPDADQPDRRASSTSK